MSEDFNLSKRIIDLFQVGKIYREEDVKEFIKRLKDEYMKYRDSFKTLEDYYRIFDDMDKLAGKKLI